MKVKMGKSAIVIKLNTDLEAPITTPYDIDVVGFQGTALSEERYNKVKEIIEEQRVEDRQKPIFIE